MRTSSRRSAGLRSRKRKPERDALITSGGPNKLSRSPSLSEHPVAVRVMSPAPVVNLTASLSVPCRASRPASFFFCFRHVPVNAKSIASLKELLPLSFGPRKMWTGQPLRSTSAFLRARKSLTCTRLISTRASFLEPELGAAPEPPEV